MNRKRLQLCIVMNKSLHKRMVTFKDIYTTKTEKIMERLLLG